jgi:hypothetical protein
LFSYPDDQPIGVFDFDELENEEALLVLCARAKPDDEDLNRREDLCFVWHGCEHDVDNIDERNFVQKCIEKYFGA